MQERRNGTREIKADRTWRCVSEVLIGICLRGAIVLHRCAIRLAFEVGFQIDDFPALVAGGGRETCLMFRLQEMQGQICERRMNAIALSDVLASTGARLDDHHLAGEEREARIRLSSVGAFDTGFHVEFPWNPAALDLIRQDVDRAAGFLFLGTWIRRRRELRMSI
jgi:hypothetical protein